VDAVATRWLERDEGYLAYSDEGQGPLIVCMPGLGDLRQEYRFLMPGLVAAGYRVVSIDLRDHGDSSIGWPDLSARAVGDDMLAVVRQLTTGQALLIGTSMAARSAIWAALDDPETVAGVVLIGPSVHAGSPWRARLNRALIEVLVRRPWGVRFWLRYWTSLFPSRCPADMEDYAQRLRASLRDPRRLAALRRMLASSDREIQRRLWQLRTPALIVMGSKDTDFPDPKREARLLAIDLRGEYQIIEDAGHYPHVEFSEVVTPMIVAFARYALAAEVNRAA
jgi:pimeloyl-ACP methyl ester carboxylesterase